jgi:hypothetical protein
MKTVYKVVEHRSGHKTSAIASGRGSLRYFKSKWTKPKIKKSLIFVFDNLHAAKHFACGVDDYEIWEAITPEVYDIVRRFPWPRNVKETEKLWTTGKSECGHIEVSVSTKGCKKLKLVKRIR